MWQWQPCWRGGWPGVAVLAWVVVGSSLWAQGRSTDPVADLKQALAMPLKLDELRNPTPILLRHREETLTRFINALQTLGEFRRALALAEWKEDSSGNMQIRDLDVRLRQMLGKRFLDAIEDIIKKGDTVSRLAVANMIGEIGPSLRSLEPGDIGGLTRSLAPSLVLLAGDADVGVRQEALRALGNVNADPQVAVPQFKKTLQSDELGPRQLAAAGLVQMVRVVSYLTKPGQSGVEARPTHVLAVATAVVGAVPAGLADPDIQVREQCLEAVQTASVSLGELIQDGFRKNTFPPEGRPLNENEKKDIEATQGLVRDEVKEYAPLLAALKDQVPHLVQAAQSPEPRVRLQAATALENLANVRLRVRRRVLSVPLADTPEKEIAAFLDQHDPLLTFLRQDLPKATGLLSDADVRIRRAGIDLLETLEKEALPALPVLVRALEDSDRFVRWAAARTIGQLPPEQCGSAVQGLGQLLHDADLSVRLAAAAALETFGEHARAAVGPLAQACVTGDTESRVAAMIVLMRLGPDHGQAAIPALIEGLRFTDARVRRTAAEVLGKYGPAARAAVPALRERLGDDDSEVRIQAGDALLSILRQRKKL